MMLITLINICRGFKRFFFVAFDIFINQTLLNIEILFKPDSSNSFFDTLKSRFLFNISDSLS